MENQSFVEYALWELWWVVILIVGPAAIAVYWEHRVRKNARKKAQEAINNAARQGIIDRRHNRIVDIRNQEEKDDNIFKTVEEYRNESD